MKMKIGLTLLLSALMVACGEGIESHSSSSKKPIIPSSSVPSTPAPSTSSTSTSSVSSPVISTSPSTSTTKPVEDKIIDIRMMGGLYPNTMRTAYALVKEGYESDVKWESSDESIVKVSERSDITTECTLIAKGYGTAVITATLVDSPEYKATFEITLSEGEAMPENLFNMMTGGMKLVSDDRCLSYDSQFNETLDEHYTITTIYEENNPSNEDPSNITDGYQISVVDNETNTETYSVNYVRGLGDYVSTESLDIYNQLKSTKFTSFDYEDGIHWDSSFYSNIWANSELINNTMFRTYDGGKTYHYSSYYLTATYLCASMYLLDLSPDDMYFTYDKDVLQLHVVADPYNRDELSSTLYGRRIVTTISEVDSAKVYHPIPYTHEDYHDAIDSAKTKMANARNYTVDVELNYPGTTDDITYKYTFTEDTIDEVIYNNGTIVSHSGAHKSGENSYYQYTYNDDTKALTIGNQYNTAWESVNRYPTFDFASEIFEATGSSSFITKGNHGLFISRCMYLGSAFSFYNFNNPGTLIIGEDGNVKEISTIVDALGDKLEVTATFSKVGTSVCDIDFAVGSDTNVSGSFEEASPIVYKNLVSWKLDTVVPYLYSKVNYNSVGYVRQRDENGYATEGVAYAFVSTNKFENTTDRDQFIEDYKALLVQNGFVDSETYEPNTGYRLYTKGDYSIGVGIELNWNNKETNAARIIVVSDKLEAPTI